jgi:hypothetical protein
VTFDETQPCNSSVFECAGDDEVGKKIFEDEEDDAGEDDGDMVKLQPRIVITPPRIIPYYRLNHSIWSLSDNKEVSH